MELDELKQAWQTLGRQLERQDAMQFQLLRDRKLEHARRSLRPLVWGQLLQMLLGLGLVLLGVACWSRNTDAPALLWTGIAVHAFGVAHIALAGITIGLIGTIDYAAPVLKIQKQAALLQRFYAFNANACGAPWWIMWVLVVVAFAGLGEVDASAGAPPWIAISLGIGLAGLLATWGWVLWRWYGGRGRPQRDEGCNVADGGDGIRRARSHLDEIARFEQE